MLSETAARKQVNMHINNQSLGHTAAFLLDASALQTPLRATLKLSCLSSFLRHSSNSKHQIQFRSYGVTIVFTLTFGIQGNKVALWEVKDPAFQYYFRLAIKQLYLLHNCCKFFFFFFNFLKA